MVMHMPGFDGTGPLRRGRAIGRGLGNCNDTGKAGTACRKMQEETADTEKKDGKQA